jgi:hypothetical protein
VRKENITWSDHVRTYNAGIYQGILKKRVPRKQLLVQKSGVRDIVEERDVEGVALGQMFEVEALQSHGMYGGRLKARGNRETAPGAAGEAGRMKRGRLLLSQMQRRKQLQCVYVKKPVVVWSGVLGVSVRSTYLGILLTSGRPFSVQPVIGQSVSQRAADVLGLTNERGGRTCGQAPSIARAQG